MPHPSRSERRSFPASLAALAAGLLLSAGSSDARAELSGLQAIATGSYHACALTAAGGVKCWGEHLLGQLGDGQDLGGSVKWARWIPVDVQGLASGVTAISTGGSHTCALTTAGTVKCWGDNYYGQLGDGTRLNRSATPVEVPGLAGVVAISAGGSHTCAIVSGGALKCWGDNYYGQIGDGTSGPASFRLSPTTVAGISGVAEVSAGSLHTCARTTAGAALCWGYNDYGQIGDGTRGAAEFRTAPTGVSGLSSGVARIVAGSRTSCAVTTGGAAQCWGFNRFSELGDGSDPLDSGTWYRPTPVQVSGLASGVAEVAPGSQHGCARLVGGGVKCWGANTLNGEVGDGTVGFARTTPVDVVGLSGATALSASLAFNCALIAGGKARCWGSNLQGQLGSAFARGIVTRPSVGIPDYQAAAGTSHTLLLDAKGQVYAWGDNTAGKLGNGNTTASTVPVRVTGLTGVVGVSAGMSHSLAVRADGTVWAWGLNADGQLGIGAVSPSTCQVFDGTGPFGCALVPQQVPGLDRVVAVAAGWRHSLALRSDGTVWRWGNDNLGGLGPGSGTGTPEQVPVVAFGVRIAAGYMHSVVVESNKNVYVWGRGELGELGPSTTTPTATPVKVSAAAGDDAVAGGGFTIVRQGTGIRAWGSNVYGVLGDPGVPTGDGTGGASASFGFRQFPASPYEMSLDVTAMAAGFGFALARKSDGSVWAWGLNNAGQLGNGGAAPDLCGWNFFTPATQGTRPCVRTPTAIPARSGAMRLLAGGAHGIAIGTDGAISVFGDNAVGQRGDRSPNYGAAFGQIVYDPDFTLTPGGTFGTPGGVGTSSTTGALNVSTISAGLAFGPQNIGTSSTAVPVTFSNLSSSPIAIFAVTVAGDAVTGEFSGAGCVGTLAGGASCQIGVVFGPAAAGTRSGTLTVASDMPNSPTMSLSMSGVGVDPRVASAVALVSSLPVTAPGASVTFTATVSAAVPPTGTVAFKDSGATIAGCAAVALASGSAACTTSVLAIGVHSITAEYSGDANVLPSASPALTHTVASSYGLSVSRAGTGGGTVSSSPAGIDCGSTCSANFADGASVSLAATPAAGSVFAGWSGACAGTGSCQVTMSAARSVTATFDLATVVSGISATPAPLAFGGQSMNTTSPSQAVTIANTGSNSITVTSVTVSTYFAVTHDCGTLAAGAFCTATVTFTPTAEGALNGTLTIASSVGNPTVSLSGTGEKSLVTHYYRSILRRAPDSGGKTFWEAEAARVQALGANVNEVWFAMSGSFYFSAEYLAFARDNTGFVTDLYNTFFNRTPDSGGLDFWKGQLDSGLPREVALAAFMFSTEFGNFTQAIFGSTAVRAEINTVVDFYRGLLSRLADDGGFNFWLGRFRTAQCAGGAAVNTEVESISSLFANSQEYANRARTNAQYVGDLYNAFLRRGGDLGGVLFWINEITSGARTRENVRQAFVASPEFQNRVAAIISQGCLP